MLCRLKLVLAATMSLALWATTGTAARADDMLYASTGGNNGFIYTINPVTQTVTQIGDTGVGRIGGLSFDNNGVLFAANGGSAGPSSLFQINPNTAAATLMGPIAGIQGVDALRFNSSGTLYAGGWNGVGQLLTINPANGNILTTTTLSGSGNSFVPGLAFRGDGTLFGSRGNAGGHTEDLDIINTSTGVMTPIGTATNIISDIWFSPSGTLYGISPTGQLWNIDTNTGAETLLFSTGIAQLSGLTGLSVGVPEPSTMALIGSAIIVSGAYAWKRRRRATRNKVGCRK